MAKKLIKNVFLVLIFAILSSNFVGATNANFRDLERQVQELTRRVKNVEENGGADSSSFNFNGRLHLEYKWDDKVNSTNTKNISVRRSKLYFGKQITDSVYFNATVAGDTSLAFDDIGFYYTVDKNLSFAIGEIFVPMSLEAELSSNTMAMTNSGNYTFGPIISGRALGVSGKYLLDRYGLSFGVFGDSFSMDPNIKDQFITAFRGYFLPYRAKSSLFHVGLSGYTRNLKGNAELKRFGGELLLLNNNFSFANEYARVYLDVKGNPKTNNLYYYYTQANLVLTGEKYNYETGCLGSYEVARPISQGGFGSFEASVRYYEEKSTELTVGAPLTNTKELAVSFNWAPENKLRNFLTYTRLDVEGEKYNKIQFSTKIFF